MEGQIWEGFSVGILTWKSYDRSCVGENDVIQELASLRIEE